MSAATLPTRPGLPEIYAYTDISSPDISIPEEMPEPTGTRFALEEERPVWQQSSLTRRRQQPINQLHDALFTTRTGPVVVFPPVTILVHKLPQTEPAEPTVSVSHLIAQVRGSLSLQITQLAAILGVERPTVYAWIKEQSEPRPQKRTRLKELYRLARRWDELSNDPLGRALTDVGSDGHAVLDFLLQSEIPHALVAHRFRAIARARGRNRAAASQEKRTVAEIAEEIGIDMTRVSEQNDQIDIVTGKRVSWD